MAERHWDACPSVEQQLQSNQAKLAEQDNWYLQEDWLELLHKWGHLAKELAWTAWWRTNCAAFWSNHELWGADQLAARSSHHWKDGAIDEATVASQKLGQSSVCRITEEEGERRVYQGAKIETQVDGCSLKKSIRQSANDEPECLQSLQVALLVAIIRCKSTPQ